MQKHNKNWWGFDMGTIDKKVRPQDDFYSHANGAWLKKTKIPPEESRWGAFTMLRYDTEQQLHTIVQDLVHTKTKMSVGSPEQLVRDLYISAFDMKERNARGIAPLAPVRMLVRDVVDAKTLLATFARLHRLGVTAGWGALVDQDSKDSSLYILHFWQGGLGLPERDYYLLAGKEQLRVREAYLVHMRKLLTLAGFDKDHVQRTTEAVMKIETKLAEVSMPKEDTRDAEKTYHKLPLVKLQKLAPAIDWATYCKYIHAPVSTVIVGQPKFFAALSKLLTTISLEEWKLYLEWHIIDDFAPLLSEPFIQEQFAFYGKTMTGQPKMRALWRRALGAVGVVGEALGQLYVAKHFPQTSKRAMDALVTDLFDVYEERIQKIDWMSAATKRKAVLKLRAMSRKIGYPTKWEHYKGLEILPDDYFGNMLRASEFHYRKHMRKLKQKVDRTEWHMTPQTVNAYCNFNLNEIVFPAAILQWPFFDLSMDMAVNYAGIGTVIGHEMTHGFDDQGAKFDGRGNMVRWWTPQDRKRFETKAKILVDQYNKFEAVDGVYVNGQLTLGENIADLGGLAIGWDAYQKYLDRNGRTVVGGLSPEERFFFGFAQMERELSRPEFTKTHALIDPHSPAPTRINGPLANFEPFYKTFNLKKGDKLYRDPSKRAQIW